jgi:hypothetical protein
MGSPSLWGPSGLSTLLQNGQVLNNGKLIQDTGSRNYINNAQLPRGTTTGWSLGTATLTSNLPTGAPTFGSGASGNLSISASSSSPILGGFSLLYASSTATTAGNFLASEALTLEREDQARVLQFKFAYEASVNPTNGNFSGTTSNSFGVAIYDVTNSAWIIPAGVFNLVQNSGVGICSGTFQTPINMTSFRVVLYNANASAGAITMKLDDFFVGPQIIPQGAAMSDSTTYTPVFTGFGTVTAINCFYARRGDAVDLNLTFTCGTSTATPGLISLPPGAVVDSAEVTTPMIMGDGGTNGATANQYKLKVAGGLSTVELAVQNASQGALTSVNASTITGAGTVVSVSARIPIAGWSSNTVMSNDTDTRVIAARASGTPATAGAGNPIIFPAVDFDTNAGYSVATGRYTVAVSGYYEVSTFLNASNNSGVAIYVNAVSVIQIAQLGWGPGVGSGSGVVKVVAGDLIDIRAGGSGTGAFGSGSSLSISRLSGPATIAASESVNAILRGQPANMTANNPIIFPTVSKDTHAAYNATTGSYTVPISGVYSVKGVAAATVAATALMRLYKNGAFEAAMGQAPIVNGLMWGSVDVKCNAGDTLYITSDNDMTSFSATAGLNQMSISRIGN